MGLKLLKFTSKRRFGVEMEVNRKLTQQQLAACVQKSLSGKARCDVAVWGYTNNNKGWVVKPDSTCGDKGKKSLDNGGFEVVSSVGRGLDHLFDIETVAAGLQAAKAIVNDFCGLHCHVEIKDFDHIKAATLLAYWCKIEPIISHMVPSRRRESIYCKMYTAPGEKWDKARKATTPSEFWTIMRLTKLDATAKRNTITLVNYMRSNSNAYEWENFDRPTVELRFPEGTLEPCHVKNWTRLFVHFVETCSHASFPASLAYADLDETMRILGLSSIDNFAVLSPGLFETRCWVLHRLLSHSPDLYIRSQANAYWDRMSSPEMKWNYDFGSRDDYGIKLGA